MEVENELMSDKKSVAYIKREDAVIALYFENWKLL